ncbi:MAG: thioredoxin-dependent thiol peroxidase [Sphingobacteriales bacterium]|nr:MAG: thioredoxin-dependent thiol peroxidase [Sphingobacteriales bacterium]
MSLAIGDKAPAFSSIDQNGKTISLQDLKGKKAILYFYPEDDTPGCTKESCNLRDNWSTLKKKGFIVIGVSPDNEESHRKFVDKFDLPFTLLVDSDKKIINDYECWGEKNMYGRKYFGVLRHTFVIDENGKIEKIFLKVDTANHTQQILESYTN